MAVRDPSPPLLDAELLGHDPDLANTVETLRRPRPGASDADSSSKDGAPVSDRGPVSPRLPPPVVTPVRPSRRVPSGFLTRALPLYGALFGRLPWRALGVLAVSCIFGASAVAWGMVFLLRPSSFAKAAARAEVGSAVRLVEVVHSSSRSESASPHVPVAASAAPLTAASAAEPARPIPKAVRDSPTDRSALPRAKGTLPKVDRSSVAGFPDQLSTGATPPGTESLKAVEFLPPQPAPSTAPAASAPSSTTGAPKKAWFE